tara:strand:+ start:2251 stop:2808 length:558 start_codon:yes stop_codon:yes gene_type:complete
MRIIALIPAKGKSNRLKNKNIYPLSGKPLLAWTLDAAKKSKYIHETYVSTESEDVKAVARENGALIIDRPEPLTKDSVGKQQVIEHALSILEKEKPVDIICLLQANSPQIETEKIDEAIEKVAHPLSQTWDCISINKNTLFTDGAIRVFRRRVVDDCGVGMYKSIILTDYIDVHYKEDIEKIKKG